MIGMHMCTACLNAHACRGTGCAAARARARACARARVDGSETCRSHLLDKIPSTRRSPLSQILKFRFCPTPSQLTHLHVVCHPCGLFVFAPLTVQLRRTDAWPLGTVRRTDAWPARVPFLPGFAIGCWSCRRQFTQTLAHPSPCKASWWLLARRRTRCVCVCVCACVCERVPPLPARKTGARVGRCGVAAVVVVNRLL